MITRLRRRPIDLLLTLVAVSLVVAAVMGYLQERTSTLDLREARDEQSALEREAAQFNLDAMAVELERLTDGTGDSAFPTRATVEAKISEIARLIEEARVELGPIVLGEIAAGVANGDIGLASEEPAPRSYQGIELNLSLDGPVEELLGLSERLLANVPEATLADLAISQVSADAAATLTVRVLLYHRPL